MVNGWHRFHSAMDDTKHIGFTRNGRAIRFVNRPNRPYENCYNFVKDRANIDLMDDQTAINDVSSTMKTAMPSDAAATPSLRKSITMQLPPSKATPSRKSLIPKRHINSNINPKIANNENRFSNSKNNNNNYNISNTNNVKINITNIHHVVIDKSMHNNNNTHYDTDLNGSGVDFLGKNLININSNLNDKKSNIIEINNTRSTIPHHRHRHHHHLSTNHSHHLEHSQLHSLANATSLTPSNASALRKKHSTMNHKKQNPLRKQHDQLQQTTLVRQMHSNSNNNNDPDSNGVLKPLKRLNRKIVSTTVSSVSAVSSPSMAVTRNPFIHRHHHHQHHHHHHHRHHNHQLHQHRAYEHLKSEPKFADIQRHNDEIDVPKAHKLYQHHFDDYSNDEHPKLSINNNTPAVTKKSDILNTKKVTNQNSGIAAKFRHSHGKHMRRKNHLVTNQSEPMQVNS